MDFCATQWQIPFFDEYNQRLPKVAFDLFIAVLLKVNWGAAVLTGRLSPFSIESLGL
jgi:hypothetical protein